MTTKKLGAVENQKPRSLEICCSSRDCAIGEVAKKDEMRFGRLVGRAISDSTVIKAFEVHLMGIIRYWVLLGIFR